MARVVGISIFRSARKRKGQDLQKKVARAKVRCRKERADEDRQISSLLRHDLISARHRPLKTALRNPLLPQSYHSHPLVSPPLLLNPLHNSCGGITTYKPPFETPFVLSPSRSRDHRETEPFNTEWLISRSRHAALDLEHRGTKNPRATCIRSNAPRPVKSLESKWFLAPLLLNDYILFIIRDEWWGQESFQFAI